MNTSSSFRLNLQWNGEFHGPSPQAGSPVVVCSIGATDLPKCTQIKKAKADLWACSGLQDAQKADSFEIDDDGDALLLLSKTAADWALATLNEVRGFLEDAGAQRNGDLVRLWVGFHQPQLSRDALHLSMRSLLQLVKGELDPEQLKVDMNNLWKACRLHHPDYQARILIVGARDMGVPYLPFLPATKYWQYGWGAKSRVLMETSSNQNGNLGEQWQKNKAMGKTVMSGLGLPTPAHVIAVNEAQVNAAVKCIGFPCVIKPLDSGGGKGVTANVRSMEEALIAFRGAHRQNHGPVLVETHVPGNDHRLMIINGEFVAAIRREPSFVVGDGQMNVEELVDRLNSERSANMVRSRYLHPIAKDVFLERHLGTQNLSLTEVPTQGQRVTLSSIANRSTGGISTNMTAICNPQVKQMALLLAKNIGLVTTGIDYLTTDITRTPQETGGAFIELNATPGLPVCVVAGWSESEIAARVLGDTVGRIPVDISICKTAFLKKVFAVVMPQNLLDGEAIVIDSHVFLGGLRMRVDTAEPWGAVRAALRNQMVTSLHVLCSASQLIKHGCPVDMVRQATIIMTSVDRMDQEWLEVLQNCSESPLRYAHENDILERLRIHSKEVR